jgi:proline iminopeptidase
MARSYPDALPLAPTWSARVRGADPAVRLAVSVGAALALGVVGSLVAPRGATTVGTALALMAVALAAGGAGGWLTGTRWVLVPVLLAHAAGIELGRLDVTAASLEVRLDTPYGIIALLITRGLHLLVLALPATSLGVALTTRRSGTVRGRPIGTFSLGMLTLGLAVLVAWPGSTPPILGEDGLPVAGSIAELRTVRLGGADQTIMIRAADPDAPVLLYLSGGPGQSDLAFSRVFAEPWTQDLVVVDLDQRGNGTSYAAIDPVSSMTLDRAVADVIELATYLRTEFDEERILVMGESWGTILGTLAVQERPDLFHAYIGSGQMVDIVETDQRIYADLVAFAERAGDADLALALEGIGTPPYRDIPWANSMILGWYDHIYGSYTPSTGYLERGERAGFVDPFGITGPEYSFIDKVNVLRGLIDTFALLYPQLYEVDLRVEAARLEVPVWILDGGAELDGRRDLALDWYDSLAAPSKRLVTFEGAAHSVAFEQADAVHRLLLEEILPSTLGRP